jgi:hypothetical protein
MMKPRKFDRKNFNYLDVLPQLVLAVKVYHEYDLEYKFKEEFKPIAHQTAGIACHQHYMYGTLLKPKKEALESMVKMSDHWLDSNSGAFCCSLDEILEYRKQLQDWFGLDCNISYANFEEGIYPIDCSAKALATLQTENFPEELDDLIEWEDDFDRVCGSVHRWSIFILGENCD